MRARGRTLGALSLLHVASNRRYDAADLTLIDDLAARAAMTLDNARLYTERDRIAAVLQRGLVPEQPPEVPGFEIAVAFEPGGEGIEVGGDFFDVVRKGDRSLIVVGDVAGRGSEAVALTSLVRHSVRAFALDSDQPSEILRKVNDVMLARQEQSEDPRFVTAILLGLESSDAGARLTVSSAGHPPALVLRRDGAIEGVGKGALLGIFHTPELSEQAVILEQGDTVILYTDGLLETGSLEHHLSVEELTGAVSGAADLSPQKIVSGLRDDAFARAGSRLADDLLVLAVRFGEAGSLSGELSPSASASGLG
jgi:serine phosphatase RsbU (regulator of sigma subunit)